MTHRAPAEGTANIRQNYLDADGRETVVHHPDLSAKHADEALDSLVQSRRADLDSRDRDRLIAEAKVLATLSMRDKLDELNANIREIVSRQCDSMVELDTTVKTATNAVVRELRKSTLREVA